MTRIKRPTLSLIIAFLAILGLGMMIWKLPPNPITESFAIAAFAIAAFLVVAWLTGSTKRAAHIVVFGVGMVLMNRFRILGWVTGGLWVAIWGLISLIS